MNEFFLKLIKYHRLRVILWTTFILLIITVGMPLLSFFYWFDADNVKKIIAEQFSSQNYIAVVNGSVEPRSWHGLSIKVTDLNVYDKTQHKIIHVNTAIYQLAWWDLLVRNYTIKRIALNGVTIDKNPKNEINYVDSLLLNYDKIIKSEFSSVNYLTISNLNFAESVNGMLTDVNLKFSSLNGIPNFQLDFKVNKYNLNGKIDGNIILDKNHNLNIEELNTEITHQKLKLTLTSQAKYDYNSRELWINNTLGNVTINDYTGSVKLDNLLWSKNGLSINNSLLSLVNNGMVFNINMTKLFTKDFENYKIDQIVSNHQLKTELWDTKVKVNLSAANFYAGKLTNKECKMNLQVKHIKPIQRNATGVSGDFIGGCSYEVAKNLLELNLIGNFARHPAKFNLKYYYDPVRALIDFKGVFDYLDLEDFYRTSDAKLLPLYYDTGNLTLNWLNWFNANIRLEVKKANINGFIIGEGKANFKIRRNNLNIQQINADIYGGHLAGSGMITKNGESFDIKLNQRVNNVNLQQLFMDMFAVKAITGRANLTLDANLVGAKNYTDLHRKLNGRIDLDVINGWLSGIDFSVLLSPQLSTLNPNSRRVTNFTKLAARFNFNNGVSSTSSLNFSAANIVASGQGVVDFLNTKIDYQLKVNSLLPNNKQQIKSVSIPVSIVGELFNPKVYIKNMTLNDAAKANIKKPKKKAQKKK